MAELLDKIEAYWSTRTEGYSEVNWKELEGKQRQAWLSVLETHFPKKEKKSIKILDVGTGPGFFPMILAQAGYQVTGIDYTVEMLEKAAENTRNYAKLLKKERLGDIIYQKMDAQHLDFADNTFDVILSRNLTWNLEYPEKAYEEWYRVLKPEGILLNFDANWYGYLYDEDKKKAYEQDRKNVEAKKLEDHYLCTDIDAMEKIALQVPLSRATRPGWDVSVLEGLGLKELHVDTQIWKKVWSEEEKLNYGSTPMFLVCGRK